ncbi:pentapeptide repeat-containing protein [Flavobacterium piscisymbiosum]|uniref:Pentapeptide repeat-containing protein n=1 Tax=Flavobacterium piscisymbiosum TaxID=2893753 RepID=A0ABS8M9U4_9FLAO|nr:pentapeptide repeat-containing protein [Flavobacterium sp. F-30]MCC9062292.1 pentapeptide repeat-containing protein [Flavobacterium sp. F-30]
MENAKIIKRIGYISLAIGVLTLLIFHNYPESWIFKPFVQDTYANFSFELLSISATILLINYLYENKEIENNKKRLIRELGSEDKGFTSRALKEIKELGYLTDGSLNGIDLSKANLEGLDFSNACLENTIFNNALLNKAIFKYANLKNTSFLNAELRESNFENAIFDKTVLKNSNLY